MFQTSEKGVQLITYSEGGNKLVAYKDNCKPPVWTIAVGCIFINNRRVVEGDTITYEQGIQMLKNNLTQREARLNILCPGIAQNKGDAIMSFAYQEGSWETSTLIKKVQANPDDPTIKEEFKKWIFVSGKHSDGVIIRRGREIALYTGMSDIEVINDWEELKDALNRTHQKLNEWMQ